MKRKLIPAPSDWRPGQAIAMFCMGLPIFDIVNGFLNRCRGAWIVTGRLWSVPAIVHHKSIKLIIWLR
jgi:hypothetical protein